MPQQLGLIAVLDNQELEQRDEQRILERRALVTGETEPRDPFENLVGRLGAYIENCWQAAKSAKESHIEPKLLSALRQREGEYDPEKLAAIKQQGGSEIYMMLTNAKCRAAEGWIRDILLPPGERPFSAKPSPVPDDLPGDIKRGIFNRVMEDLQAALASGMYITPEEVYQRTRELYQTVQSRMKQDARERAERMEDAIDDILVEGQWYEALEAMLPDFVCLHAAFLKGPVIRKQSKLQWVQDQEGKFTPKASDELTPIFYSPSPFDMYPAPDSKGVQDGYLIEKMHHRRSAIYKMIGVPGYKEDAIRAALAEYHRHGQELPVAMEQERRELENNPDWQMTPDHGIDCYEFHGAVRGEWLIEWGMTKDQVPDPDAEYEVTALKIGRFIVRCVLNEDPMGRRPYDKCSYDEIKGQFWGRGIPDLIRDCQDICNATARALVNNMGFGSGPMGEVEVDRLAEGEDVTSLHPWRIFQTKASRTTPAPAVRFFMPPLVAEQLMRVYAQFSQLADNYSGVPQYEQGVNPTQGAAGTASGLSMLMTSASRLIKRALASIDKTIKGSVTRVHTYIMLYRSDEMGIKGDTQIVARGSSSLVAKEQMQLRRTQFLQATANPIDMQIIGPMGRAELLRDSLRTLDFNPDDIVPPKDQMLAQIRQQAMMAQAQAQAQQQQAMLGQQAGPAQEDQAGNVAGGQERALFGAAA